MNTKETSLKTTNYQPLEPITVEKVPCPRLKKVATVFMINLTAAVFAMSIGAALSFAGLGISLTVGLVVGVIVGLALGIALTILLGVPKSPKVQYRIQTLDQIKSVTTNPKVLDAVEKVKKVFSEELPTFSKPYEMAGLYDAVAEITLQMRERKDLKKVMETFLNNIQGTRVIRWDGTKRKLDFSNELNRLGKKEINVVVEKVDAFSDEEVEQMKKLYEDCFGLNMVFNEDYIGEVVEEEGVKRNVNYIVARNQATGEIIGFLRYDEMEDGKCYIPYMGRKSENPKLKIGDHLFQKLMETHFDRDIGIDLHVLPSNTAAISLYERFGFYKKELVEDYYSSLPEKDAYLMTYSQKLYEWNVQKAALAI